MRRLAPGEVVALGLVAEALVLDVVLIRRGHDPISTCVRGAFLARAVTVAIAVHLCAHVPHDPLSALGRRLTRSTP